MADYTSDVRARLMETGTSIRTDIPCPGVGRIVTLGFPGLAFDLRGASFVDRGRMEATLADPALAACRLLVVLVERSEVPPEGWDLLGEIAAARSVRVVHLPIRDYAAPDDAFLTRWAALAPDIAALLAAGQTLALSCHYGAGRSGTIAASLLMDRGLSAEAAIAAVRARFAESIESERQLAWLHERERAP